MSASHIPEKTKVLLWGKAGGRCQYQGCNEPLWLDSLTQFEFNASYIAHIIADSPAGPRGDDKLSEKLKDDLSNLMLMCDEHHRLIDKVDVDGHPVDLLREMKARHEDRIELLTSLQPNRRSEVLLFGARIGEHSSPLSFQLAAHGMLPDWYPASRHPLILGTINSSFDDRDDEFWRQEAENLHRKCRDQVRERLALGEIQHLSVFGLAPQPLLTMLGSLLTDIPAAEVYHLFREPADWRWREHPDNFALHVGRPDNFRGTPVLKLALTADINDDRIRQVLGDDVSIWTLTVPEVKHDAVPSRQGLCEFRQAIRKLFNEIKTAHGEKAILHVFPAMGVSTSVELGRVHQPKADLPMRIYDQNRNNGGFVYALTLPYQSPGRKGES